MQQAKSMTTDAAVQALCTRCNDLFACLRHTSPDLTYIRKVTWLEDPFHVAAAGDK